MYIDRIQLTNIRGFQHLDFNLDRGNGEYAGWTVFTGDNGSGKSALLKAIAVGLVGKDESRGLQPSFKPWIRLGTTEASIRLEFVPSPEDQAFCMIAGGRLIVELDLRNGTRHEPSMEETLSMDDGQRLSEADLDLVRSTGTADLSCGYGPFRRIYGASPEAVRQMVAPTVERFVTMFQEAASLAEVDAWMKTLSHRSLEGKANAEVELTILKRVLNDELMPNGVRVDEVDSDGLWLRDRNGVRLPWGEMSDGYRSALALLADIVRHLTKNANIADLTEESEGKLTILANEASPQTDEMYFSNA